MKTFYQSETGFCLEWLDVWKSYFSFIAKKIPLFRRRTLSKSDSELEWDEDDDDEKSTPSKSRSDGYAR